MPRLLGVRDDKSKSSYERLLKCCADRGVAEVGVGAQDGVGVTSPTPESSPLGTPGVTGVVRGVFVPST